MNLGVHCPSPEGALDSRQLCPVVQEPPRSPLKNTLCEKPVYFLICLFNSSCSNWSWLSNCWSAFLYDMTQIPQIVLCHDKRHLNSLDLEREKGGTAGPTTLVRLFRHDKKNLGGCMARNRMVPRIRRTSARPLTDPLRNTRD